jgi:type IV pilus assembly protein PilF
MNRGQYEVALGKLKKAVKADPGYAPGQTVIAVLYERIGEIDLAGKHYHKAYEADPTNGDVNNNYGTYLCKTGKEDKAIEHFLAALDDPFYISPSVALTNAGSCTLGKGDLVAANDYLRRALKIEPEFPDALMAMVRLNYEQQNYLKSRAFLQRYEAVASHDATSLLLAYKIETASGNTKTASKYKRTLEATFPKSDQAAEARRISGR